MIGSSGLELGTTAKLTDPFGWYEGDEYEPLIPGPDKKKPKTSLYWEFSNSKYSWDPKI